MRGFQMSDVGSTASKDFADIKLSYIVHLASYITITSD